MFRFLTHGQKREENKNIEHRGLLNGPCYIASLQDFLQCTSTGLVILYHPWALLPSWRTEGLQVGRSRWRLGMRTTERREFLLRTIWWPVLWAGPLWRPRHQFRTTVWWQDCATRGWWVIWAGSWQQGWRIGGQQGSLWRHGNRRLPLNNDTAQELRTAEIQELIANYGPAACVAWTADWGPVTQVGQISKWGPGTRVDPTGNRDLGLELGSVRPPTADKETDWMDASRPKWMLQASMLGTSRLGVNMLEAS